MGVTEVRFSRRVATESETVTASLLWLLTLTWLIEGFLALAGLPHRLDVVVDGTEVLVCVWLAVRLLRGGAIPRVPILVGLYAVWVLLGLDTHAPAGAAITSARNFLLLPTLAFLVAASGTNERRARIVSYALLALATFEVALTILQSFRFTNADRIVGTFGNAANAATAAAILMTVSVGIAGFLVNAPGATAGLAAAIALPLFAAWAAVKLVPFVLPLAVVAVALLAVLRRRTTWRRVVTALAASAVASGLIIGYYAAYRPDSFAALFHTSARAKYLRSASVLGTTLNPNGTQHLTGRLTQWRTANREISGSTRTKLFGKGLGTATVAENVGVYPKDLTPGARLASFSDFGTLLVERGWSGIAAVALFAIALVVAAWRLVALLPAAQWTTAFTVAVPGVVCVMAAYGPFAEELRNAAAAFTFWLVVALGLSPAWSVGAGARPYAVVGRRKTN